MSTVLMDVDAFNVFGIAVSGNMIALVNNKNALARGFDKICKSCSEKACANDEVVNHSTNINYYLGINLERPVVKRSFVSFDVFDTCLIRRCGRPKKIWDLMAEQLFDKDDVRGKLSFVGNRSIVESVLSKMQSHPNLSDIYEKLNVTQWGFEKNTVMDLEMKIEEQELFPNPEVLEIVNSYRKQGFCVAFISDMYLPSLFIKKILMKFGFALEGDEIFVSAECKACKFDGSLFKFVFKETQTKAGQWNHFGDNKRSDFLIPKSLGIKAKWIDNTDFSSEEKRWLDDARFYEHKNEIELWSGLCRLTRLQQQDLSMATTMAIDFVASLYVPYVQWVLDESQKKGLTKLYFLGRDGHVFYEIAKAVKSNYPDIDLAYLKISRRVLYPCVFYNGDDFELDISVGCGIGQRVADVLMYLGIRWECLSEATRNVFKADDVLGTLAKISLFKQQLKKYDLDFLKRNAQKRRKNLLGYLDQNGIGKSDVCALVDLGWTGSCRCILNYILKQENLNPVKTFYWGVNKNLLNGTPEDELYVYQRQYDILDDAFCANLFLEQYASMNVDGSVIDYVCVDDRFTPVEKPRKEENEKIVKINEMMSTRLISQMTFWTNAQWKDIFLCCGLKQFNRILNNPSRKEMRFFSYMLIENYGREAWLIERMSVKNLFAFLVWNAPATPIWNSAVGKRTFGCLFPLMKNVFEFTSQTKFAEKLRNWWENRK